MAKTFPINWGFGGIAWSNTNGVRSLFVVLRFGVLDQRRAFGFILRVGDRRRAFLSARRKPWIFGRIQIAGYGA